MESVSRNSAPQVSIILPTYNESQNILKILKSIGESIPKKISFETIIIDDNSPDGTGNIVEEYVENVREFAHNTINVIHRKAREGLSSAIMSGIQQATGDTIVVMDSDLSHPANIIPKMLDALKSKCDLVIASRYVPDGAIEGWNLKRKLISKTATEIAKKCLGIDTADPMSGFFAFKKKIINDLKFDAIGYKMLLEILVKTKEVNVTEIPYTFTDRQFGVSKLDTRTILDYLKSVWRLYLYGKNANPDRRNSTRFLSKAARFFTVGASGLGVNYLMSLLFAGGIAELWYVHANMIGIAASMSSNFILNKYWTFGDRNFAVKKTITQYAKFIAFSSFGALAQLGLVYTLVDGQHMAYPTALMISVGVSALGNFILNKKWTFKEKIWG